MSVVAVRQAEYRKRRYLNGGQRILLPSCGAQRRLRALARQGWSFCALERHLGVCSRSLADVFKNKNITPAKNDLVTRLYDELWNVAPPTRNMPERVSVARAKTAARQGGWFPPGAWDDDTIDDPEAKPWMPKRRTA